ncbi:MAG: urease accessory protein UreF [Salinisphaera sp.]|jgi:urease accessory protein|nr:urease accessory protein UreF [Salinisphaera sp.]
MKATAILIDMKNITTPMAESGRVLQLQRLFQLASPSLPVGAFAYSEGLEAAVEAGWLSTADDVQDWLAATLDECLARLDLPLCLRLHAAWQAGDIATVRRWSHFNLAVRETAERRAQERHLGTALATLLHGMDVAEARHWRLGGAYVEDVSFATLFSLAAVRWQISDEDTAAALAWAWLENQVLAAVKLVPLGQTQGQKLLFALSDGVPHALALAAGLEDDDLGGSLPGVTLASTAHETMYSRLYRS